MIKEFFNISQRQNQERWDKAQMMNSEEAGKSTAECPQGALSAVTRNKDENKKENRKTESAGDGPVSCRLRSRAHRIDGASQSWSTAAAPRGISKTKSKAKSQTKSQQTATQRATQRARPGTTCRTGSKGFHTIIDKKDRPGCENLARQSSREQSPSARAPSSVIQDSRQ
ncbi:hypothetical protein PV05_03266 [Exophiala xenobiotica]|uniref:Uncharacterized protein n=1 Tax=Exophiala xenobiotica TaxID=348802 RepID=A0A0D2ESR0_9EURO|nr:uncharacterized protein PV05_03266 [Exophiala xenobiotica]KIW58768.1 hypothetical protein PV05_03266 [Exophiala xenobiotica]